MVIVFEKQISLVIGFWLLVGYSDHEPQCENIYSGKEHE
jgi:hypothetical protein